MELQMPCSWVGEYASPFFGAINGNVLHSENLESCFVELCENGSVVKEQCATWRSKCRSSALSGQNDERVFAVARNSRSFNLFDNEETSYKDWNPFKTAGENVSSTAKRQISERKQLNELCQPKKKLF